MLCIKHFSSNFQENFSSSSADYIQRPILWCEIHTSVVKTHFMCFSHVIYTTHERRILLFCMRHSSFYVWYSNFWEHINNVNVFNKCVFGVLYIFLWTGDSRNNGKIVLERKEVKVRREWSSFVHKIYLFQFSRVVCIH